MEHKIEFNKINIAKSILSYRTLTENHGLFGEAMDRNCKFHCIAEAIDLNSMSFNNRIGWSCIVNYRLKYSPKTFPLFGTYVKEEYRNKGISSWLTMLTLDMAEENNINFMVIDYKIKTRMKNLGGEHKVKMLPIWFDFYPILLYPKDRLSEEERDFFASFQNLKDLGIDNTFENLLPNQLNDLIELENNNIII